MGAIGRIESKEVESETKKPRKKSIRLCKLFDLCLIFVCMS